MKKSFCLLFLVTPKPTIRDSPGTRDLQVENHWYIETYDNRVKSCTTY